jgi:hypothetical protein
MTMAKTSNRIVTPASLKALDAALAADSTAGNRQMAFIHTMFKDGNGMIGDMIKSGETWKAPDGSGDIKSTNDSDNALFFPIQVRFFAHICANAKVLATVVKVMQSPKKDWGKHSKKTMVTYLDRNTASETFGKRVPCTVSEINSRATSILGKYRRAAWFATETPIKKVKASKLSAAHTSILNGIAKLAPRYNDKGNVVRWEGETPKAATARVAQHKSLSAYAKKLGIKD